MANLKKIIYINEEDYSTLLNGGSITKGGVTYTYDATALYVIKNVGVPEYAETAGYAEEAGTATSALNDGSGRNIASTYALKSERVFKVMFDYDGQEIRCNKTYAQIHTAVFTESLFVIGILVGENDMIRHFYLSDDSVEDGDNLYFTCIDFSTVHVIEIDVQDHVTYDTFNIARDANVLHKANEETITGKKTFSGAVVLGSNATATTQSAGNNSTKVATTQYVDRGLGGKADSATTLAGYGITDANLNDVNYQKSITLGSDRISFEQGVSDGTYLKKYTNGTAGDSFYFSKNTDPGGSSSSYTAPTWAAMTSALEGKQDEIDDLATIRSNASNAVKSGFYNEPFNNFISGNHYSFMDTNALYAFSERAEANGWTVTHKLFNSDGTFVKNLTYQYLFDGSYEHYNKDVREGTYAELYIGRNPEDELNTTQYIWTYGIGELFLQFYSNFLPESVSLQVYCASGTYQGWRNVAIAATTDRLYNNVYDRYGATLNTNFQKVAAMKITYVGKNTGSYGASLCQVEYNRKRGSVSDSPTITKYPVAQSFWGDVTAPKFITRNGGSTQLVRGDGTLLSFMRGTTHAKGGWYKITFPTDSANTTFSLVIESIDASYRSTYYIISGYNFWTYRMCTLISQDSNAKTVYWGWENQASGNNYPWIAIYSGSGTNRSLIRIYHQGSHASWDFQNTTIEYKSTEPSSWDESVEGSIIATTEHKSFHAKQDALVSGTNIKTINGESLLGSGNITISGGGGGTTGGGNAKIFYGTCSTAAGTAAKTVTCDSFTSSELVEGAVVLVTFGVINTAAVGSLTLNVNGTGAYKIVKQYNVSLANLTNAGEIRKTTYAFVFSETSADTFRWVMMGYDYNSTYSAMTLSEAVAGTATTGRTITANGLHNIFALNATARTVKMFDTTANLGIEETKPTTATSQIQGSGTEEFIVTDQNSGAINFNPTGIDIIPNWTGQGNTVNTSGTKNVNINTGAGKLYYNGQEVVLLPAVTTADNGKILKVVNGQWTLANP